MSKKCPKCGLLNADNNSRCNCGYDFATGQMVGTTRLEMENGQIIDHPDEKSIEGAIRTLDWENNSFAVLHKEDGSFMKAAGGPDTFILEHVDDRRGYHSKEDKLSLEAVIRRFLAYWKSELEISIQEVKNAYKPSGMTNFSAVLLMLLLGGIVAVAGGYLLGKLLPLIVNLARRIDTSTRGRQRAFIQVMLSFPLSSVLGLVIRFAVYCGGRLGKNRNKWVRKVIGIFCGLVVVAVVGIPLLQLSGDLGEKIIFLVGGVSLFLFLALLLKLSGVEEEKPFCELHNRFMKEEEVFKLQFLFERDAIAILSRREFEKIFELPSAEDCYIIDDEIYTNNNYSTIKIWYCEECMSGYISMITQFLVWKDDGTKSTTRSVFSSSLEKPEVEKILNKKKAEKK
ncbi:MAG: hypothetical protein DRP87_16990 [Spirochaetes bacterium]|nr:MAG: hypothetical protein DRP87_16990 [Spirochaetota bacterium]